MRTTLDLPTPLGQKIKIVAARRGITLKQLVITALEHELAPSRTASSSPLRFPLISSKKPGSYHLKPETISEILIREERAAYEASDRP